MTIAAGFLSEDGVILCAETQHSSWAMKLDGSKIANFQCPSGVVAFAYAGNSRFAVSVVQKCKRKLEALPPVDLRVEIERILAEEYEQKVWRHPSQATDGSLHYQFLVAIRQPSERAQLFVTSQTSLSEVDGYDCIGVGDYLSHYLIRSVFNRQMPERELLSLCAYTLRAIKRHVDGCDGYSQFLVLGHDSMVRRFMCRRYPSEPSNYLEWIEEYSAGFDKDARSLLFALADPGMSESQFRQALDEFNVKLLNSRNKWKEQIQKHPELTHISWTSP